MSIQRVVKPSAFNSEAKADCHHGCGHKRCHHYVVYYRGCVGGWTFYAQYTDYNEALGHALRQGAGSVDELGHTIGAELAQGGPDRETPCASG